MKKVMLLAPAAALVLAGCAHDPTVAAKVGGQSVPTGDVSVMASYLCAGAKQGQQVVPMAEVNKVATTYLVGTKAVEEWAKRNHLTVPAVATSASDPLIAFLPAGQRHRASALTHELNSAISFVAQHAGASNSQQAFSAMASLIQSETKAGVITGNPAYPTVVTDEGSLSTAVSASAKNAGSSQPDSGYVASLPAGQKCG
ncbi:MAG: hypothetical protein ACTHOG_13160 [Marmoricola sp.]